MDLTGLSLPLLAGIFLATALVIGVFGVLLTREADRLADATGLGEAVMGGAFLGGVTSISGTITSVTAAASGHADLAVSNALGGIAAQTVFLAVADMAYRRANLEHAASSLPNMLQTTLLVALLALPLLAITGPAVSLFGVHPLSLVLIPAYLFGMRLVSHVQKSPLWQPRLTDETRADKTKAGRTDARRRNILWLRFGLFGGIVGFAGYLVAKAGVALSALTGLSETVVGTLFTAVSTSLPELITSVAAVRRGALTLAVGGIVGGNCFDVLFLLFADVAYRDGSIYHAIGSEQIYLIALALLLTSILLLGLLRREKHGLANIGFESIWIVVTYLAALAVLVSQW